MEELIMSLNVQWRWNMPTVGDPDKVAAGNRADFLSGLDSIASGLIKSGENKRADEKQQWLENTTAQKFAHQVEQDQLAQQNANRNYMLQRDQFNLNKEKQLNDIARQKKQDEYIQKMYDYYFSNDAEQQELQKLLAKYQGKDGATNVMNGLNPLFLNLR
jgi:thioesterase domain-containing protein